MEKILLLQLQLSFHAAAKPLCLRECMCEVTVESDGISSRPTRGPKVAVQREFDLQEKKKPTIFLIHFHFLLLIRSSDEDFDRCK